MEVVISAMLTGLVIVPALIVFGSITQSYAVRGEQATADCLAQGLLSEIVQLAYQDPDPIDRTFGSENGEVDRADFDDVDDFEGLIETPPLKRDGTALDDVEKFSRSVSVVFVDPADPSQVLESETGLKRIRVQVDSPFLNSPVTLFAFRSSNGPTELEPEHEKTVTRRVELQLGKQELPVLRTGMNILNETKD